MMNKNTESGQAIILLVFAVIGLIGFTALAIDGGMVYSDRRHAQSASDASSLAGGGFAALALENYRIYYNNSAFVCGSAALNQIISGAMTTAMNRAISNDYTNAEVTVNIICEDHGPMFDEKYLDVITTVVRKTDTNLLHFVYDGPAINQVESTVRVRPRNPFVYGQAIVALNDDACYGNQNGVSFNGSSSVNVNGGGVFSNGCFDCDGLACPDEEDDICVNVEDGSVMYAGSNICDKNDKIDPSPTSSGSTLPARAYTISPPHCDADDAIRISSITGSINLNAAYPGKRLICLTNSVNAIKITSSGETLTGTGITLYAENSGDIEISGGIVNLAAPMDDDPYPGISGVLIYVNPEDPSVILINGNSDSSYLGMIYAPNADVEVTGSGTIDDPTVYNTQIVGNNVKIGGGAYIDIDFSDEDSHSNPSNIDLTK